MFIFALFSVLNDFSIIIYKNDCPFGMIRVWESFCDGLSLWEGSLFWAKSNAQFVRELSFYYDFIERYSFSFLWQKYYFRFEVDKRGSNLSISNGRFVMLISKWKASYHLEKKIRLSFQNDKIIISKWQLSPSFQNDSFA